MREERILITGSGGMLGNAIFPCFNTRYSHVLATDKELTEPWLMQLDVRDDRRLEQVFQEFRPDIVLHLAAETSLEYCELNPDVAKETNARGTETIAKLCTVHNATLVYISTAGIFDGRKNGFYTEEDLPNPIMTYGQTKLEGELLAAKYCKRTFVVRAGWMMGGGREREKKFIYKILQQVENGRHEIFAVDDLWGTPTYTHDFAMNLFSLLDTHHYGTYHMVCEGAGTRYDVAKEILDICHRDDIRLSPVTSDFFREEYFVKRPLSEMMINANLRKIGCHRMRDWKTALREYIETCFADFIADSQSPRALSCAEKRRETRQPAAISFSFTQQNEDGVRTHFCRSVDISEEGLCVVSDFAIPPQKVVTVRSKSSENWCQAAMVRWSSKAGSSYRIGLKYLEPPREFAAQYAHTLWGNTHSGENHVSQHSGK